MRKLNSHLYTDEIVLVLSIHFSYLLATETAVVASFRGPSAASTSRLEISNYTADEIKNLMCASQMKHQVDATLCRFYFCRVTLHVSCASAHHQESLKTSTAATGTCVIVVGQSSHLLIRAEGR